MAIPVHGFFGPAVLMLAQFGPKFSGLIREPLPVYGKSFTTTAVAVSLVILLTNEVTTNRGDQKQYLTR